MGLTDPVTISGMTSRHGSVTSEALSSLALGGVPVTLGYSAGRKPTIDVTDLIWKRARMAGFSLFAQSPNLAACERRPVVRREGRTVSVVGCVPVEGQSA